MNRPRFSFRPSPQNPDHRAAWDALMAVPEGQRNSFLVRAILRVQRDSVLEETLRRVLREELANLSIPQPDQDPDRPAGNVPDTPPIPQEMMGFLNNLMLGE